MFSFFTRQPTDEEKMNQWRNMFVFQNLDQNNLGNGWSFKPDLGGGRVSEARLKADQKFLAYFQKKWENDAIPAFVNIALVLSVGRIDPTPYLTRGFEVFQRQRAGLGLTIRETNSVIWDGEKFTIDNRHLLQ
jgi:hypothetical protein